jgi:hypothetical protein
VKTLLKAHALVGSPGCKLLVQQEDSLYMISKDTNVNMDAVQVEGDVTQKAASHILLRPFMLLSFLEALNTIDLTNPGNLKAGMLINVPCVGTDFKKFSPLRIAGNIIITPTA